MLCLDENVPFFASIEMSPDLKVPLPFPLCAIVSHAAEPVKAALRRAQRRRAALTGPTACRELHFPDTREWKLLDCAQLDISTEVGKGTFLTRLDNYSIFH